MTDVSLSNGAILPPDWESVSLGEVAQINPALDRCIIEDSTEVNFVPMRSVEPEGGGLRSPQVRRFDEVKKGYTAFVSGDVIMAKITPCMENGKTTVVPELPGSVCFGSTEFHVIRPEDGVAPRWISSFLLQHEIRRAAQRQMTGGVGQMRVPGSFLETVRIPLPPVAEQQRISDALDELFSDLDAGVGGLDRVRTKLAHYRAALLKAAVEGALTADWRLQHPATEPASKLLERILTERRRRWEEEQRRKFKHGGKEPPKNWRAKYKEPVAPDITQLPSLPEGWCWATVDQLAWSSGYGTSQKCRATEPGVGVLRIPNILGGRVDLTDLKFAPQDFEPEEWLVGVGDLLVVRTNGSRTLIGRGAVVRAPLPLPLAFASYLIRMRITPSARVLAWISLLWGSSYVRKWIETRAATSAGQFNISLGVLSTLVFPLPPTAEEEVIVEVLEDQLSVIEHLEADLEAKWKAAGALRQAILRHAFTGKLVPQDPNDEPASELLRRIAAEREARGRETAAIKRARKQPTKTRLRAAAGR